MTTIYLVRHGESESNANAKKDYLFHEQWGQWEAPLTDIGQQQAEKRAESLKRIHFDAIFSSDTSRAKQTAEIIRLNRELEIQTVQLIRERRYHGYVAKQKKNGKTSEQLQEEIKNDLAKLDEKGKMAYKHGEGMESPEESMTRLLIFLREIAIAYDEKTILVTSHGNIMRSLMTHLGYAKFDELPKDAIENTGYVVLESDGVDFFIKETHGINKKQGTVRIF